MTDDDLRARLARIDPVRSAGSSEPFTSLRVQSLLEHAMSTPTPTRSRRPMLAAAAVLAIGAAGGGVFLTQGDDNGPAVVAAPTILRLGLPAGGGGVSMNSCAPFDVNFLKGMTPAFAGTATTVTASSITLDVDRWYTGGDADQVVLSTPDATSSAALDGVEFEQGKRYLVTAAEGTVNGCGFSGLATPDLEKSFAEAFPAS